MVWSCMIEKKVTCSMQARWNGFEHTGDGKTPVTFKPFVVQTSNLQFWKWEAKYRHMVEPYMLRRACNAMTFKTKLYFILLENYRPFNLFGGEKQVVFRHNHRGLQHSFFYGSIRTFDMFAAEAKWAGFNIIKCVLRPRRKAKIIASLRGMYLTLP